MKLEAIDPVNQNNICPVTIMEVIDAKYFIVDIDETRKMEPDKRLAWHAIKILKLFSQSTGQQEVPEHEFECGMKLEAVKPSLPSQLYAATITKIVDPLMWIHYDSSKKMNF
ncbi:scm-like with four MBT domains protein 1, partial [Biomphalaria pfeifferi]